MRTGKPRSSRCHCLLHSYRRIHTREAQTKRLQRRSLNCLFVTEQLAPLVRLLQLVLVLVRLLQLVLAQLLQLALVHQPLVVRPPSLRSAERP